MIVFDKIKKTVYEKNRPLLIFPKETRVKFNEIVPFKKGVGRIYDALGLHCIPVALNSGKIWPTNSFLKYSGDIHITFLEPIEPGIEKNTFVMNYMRDANGNNPMFISNVNEGNNPLFD